MRGSSGAGRAGDAGIGRDGVGFWPTRRSGQQPSDPRRNERAISPAKVKQPAPTYTKDVAAILQAKCQNCHRRHQVGPFALETYEQARKRSHDIAAVTEERSMPPWKPTAGVGPKLKHDQSLTHAEIADPDRLGRGRRPAGRPQGPAAAAQVRRGLEARAARPDPRAGRGLPVPASGPDVYRCFVLPTNLARDSYLEAVDYAPGERRRRAPPHRLHRHDRPGRVSSTRTPRGRATPRRPGRDSMPDELSFWTAGSEPHRLPEGIGIRIPASPTSSSRSTTTPTARPASTRHGSAFTSRASRSSRPCTGTTRRATTSSCPPATTTSRSRRAGTSRSTSKPWPSRPTCTCSATTCTCPFACPTAATENLIEIADWDPSWQSAYYFQKPIPLLAGSVVNVVAHFDNSAHSRNPNQPPKLVKVGPNFDDEMCVGYIAVVKKGQDLTAPGARDDLFEIFFKQRERIIRKHMAKKPH